MNELTLTLIRVAFLAVLWLFVIAAIGVVRTDLSGSAGTRPRGRAPAAAGTPRGAGGQARQARQAAAGPARAASCACRDGWFPEGNDH